MSANSTTARRLVWHRRDLRLRDNELYGARAKDTTKVVALYVIDPSDYELRPCCSTPFQTVSVGPHAARGLVEALTNLRENLQLLGSDLVIKRGDPRSVVPSMARAMNSSEVVWSEEPGEYERQLSDDLLKILSPSVTVRTFMGYTLFHPDDLPRDEDTWSRLARPKEKKNKVSSPEETLAAVLEACETKPRTLVDVSAQRLKGIPKIMGDFRRAARTAAPVRPCLPPPLGGTFDVEILSSLDPGELPTLDELTTNYKDQSLFGLPCDFINQIIQSAHERLDANFSPNGENFALLNLQDFVENHAATANRSAADVSDNHQSAHTSTALATGSLSPRQVYWESVDKPGREWLVSHMEMRDYFVYTALVSGTKLYHRDGIQQSSARGKKRAEPVEWKKPADNMQHFTRWATGDTQLPLVDAGMQELIQTGYCSNRVRQNQCSVLAKDLEIDWRIGAEWFQFCLEDHCVAANYGNWQYFGGVGQDPKNRHFRTVSQAVRHDPDGDLVKKWIPRLRDAASTHKEAVFRPWDFVSGWGAPLVDPITQYTWQDRQRLEETGCLLQDEETQEK